MNARKNKYDLYEQSVQSPDVHIGWFVSMYKEIHGKYACRMREDFCGTFQLSCAWVKRNRNNTALSLDLDAEPLSYGKKRHWGKMTQNQRNRLEILRADVLNPTSPKVDLIIACNFSFYIFKERSKLLRYFKSCLKSLRTKGALVLEMAGGPGMIAPMREQKTVTGKKGEKFLYIWEQKAFNPISHDSRYSIHFKFPNGTKWKNAFVYDWRLWTIPEVRDILKDAGFKKSYVYWESSFRGKATGELVQTEAGDNAYAWIAYVVGVP